MRVFVAKERSMATAYGARTILIEDKSSGTQLIQDLIRDGLNGVTRYEPQLDKIMRLHSVTSTIENGFVYLSKEAPWLAEYVDELTTFPAAKYDDQTDSTSQALDWVKTGIPCLGLIDYEKHEAAKLESLVSSIGQSENRRAERVAIQNTTGRKIRWNGQNWVDFSTGEQFASGSFLLTEFTPFEELDPCPQCGSRINSQIGPQRRCIHCGHQWPPVKLDLRPPTRKDLLNGRAYPWDTKLSRWR